MVSRADPGFEVRGGANGLEDFETGGGGGGIWNTITYFIVYISNTIYFKYDFKYNILYHKAPYLYNIVIKKSYFEKF